MSLVVWSKSLRGSVFFCRWSAWRRTTRWSSSSMSYDTGPLQRTIFPLNHFGVADVKFLAPISSPATKVSCFVPRSCPAFWFNCRSWTRGATSGIIRSSAVVNRRPINNCDGDMPVVGYLTTDSTCCHIFYIWLWPPLVIGISYHVLQSVPSFDRMKHDIWVCSSNTARVWWINLAFFTAIIIGSGLLTGFIQPHASDNPFLTNLCT